MSAFVSRVFGNYNVQIRIDERGAALEYPVYFMDLRQEKGSFLSFANWFTAKMIVQVPRYANGRSDFKVCHSDKHIIDRKMIKEISDWIKSELKNANIQL